MRALCLIICGLMLAPLIAGEPEPDSAQSQVYRFLGGEKVRVIVSAAVNESFEQIVSDDGTLSLPTGTTINLKGRSLAEARKLIIEQLEKESTAKHIQVALVIVEMTPRKIYIGGEVKTPKSVTLVVGIPLSLLDALQEGGGVADSGDPTRVNVVRTEPDGSRKALIVDVTRLAQPGNSDLGPRLQAGDVVVVPRAETFFLAGEIAKTGLLNRKDLFLAPGEQIHLSRVLLGAGGLKSTANRKNVRVLRLTSAGARKIISVNLDKNEKEITASVRTPGQSGDASGPATGQDSSDPVVQDGDIIVVGASNSASTVAIMGKVKAPGVFPLTDGLKVTRLIMLAGGFTEYAKGSVVTVVRASKSRTVIKVDVDAIIKSGDWDRDVELEDGDVVVVPERMF